MAKSSALTLCDTNIIIEAFKGEPRTIAALQKIGLDTIAVSAITVMELYYGALNKSELAKIKKHLAALELFPITPDISDLATMLIERYAKSHGLQIPDAVIAATAIIHRLPLFTYNTKDFRFIEELSLHAVVK
ncbi:MAG TPA: type II toxin-antitoxin system VapC family toxin [bacterium]|nr:type II toxin-antitoxin system VapC family toxin [bacterium]